MIFLAKLAPLVNIIPVVAKKDAMTNEEFSEFSDMLRKAFADYSLPLFFDKTAQMQSFGIIGSQKLARPGV